MNTKMLLGGAIALSLTFAVGSASADDIQIYGATFESAANTTPGEKNDWAYALDAGVTTYANTTGTPYGWFGGADDASTIIAANGGQALRVDTVSSPLTNKLESSVASDINSGFLDAGAYFEADMKLTAFDVLGEGIPDGADAPKFALYSYCDSTATPCTTNLVIYHAYLDNDVFVRTNEVFGTIIDAEAYTKVRIVMKKIQVGETERNVFSVALNGGEPITSDLAVSEDVWFLTAEDTTGAEAQGISSVSFSGSGEVDNIGMGILSNTSFTDPEGRVIEDPAVIDWLLKNSFTQNDINALGSNDAGTEKLYECFLLNCSIKGANPGGALSITGFVVTNGVVSVSVQLVRQSPLGFINGVLNLHGTDDLANDFGLIDGTRLDFSDGDSIFDTASTPGPVTQTVTATFDNAFFTEKFFKAVIEFPIPENPEDPWEPEPEEPEELEE